MGPQEKKSGCWKVAIILGVLALIALPVAVLLPAWFVSRVNTEHRMGAMEAMGRDSGVGTVVFEQDAIPKFAPHQPGEKLPREQFVALMIDELATELARKDLQETANGTLVTWLLQTGDIYDRNGVLGGQFTLPYEIRSGHGMRGSSVSVNCEFLPESRDALLRVRRGDWVTVEGKLALDGRAASITEARIVDDQTTPGAERPAE